MSDSHRSLQLLGSDAAGAREVRSEQADACVPRWLRRQNRNLCVEVLLSVSGPLPRFRECSQGKSL